MAIMTRPPQTPVTPRSIAERPRRWPRRLLLITITLTVALLIGGVVWLRSYQPLVGGGGGSYSVRPARLVTGSFDASGWRDGSFTQYHLRMEPGVTYRVGFPVWNDGPLPVTITGLASWFAGEKGDTTRASIAGTTPMNAGEHGVMRDPFAPFTLGPGEGIDMFVDFTVVDTKYVRGTGTTVNTVALRYTTAKMVQNDAELFLGMSIEICKPPCG